jgi:DNA-directed RNA polymerase specialized sigma24 family protein
VGGNSVDLDLGTLDQALTALANVDPKRSRVVELRVFGGFSTAEIAAELGVHPRTVLRYWEYAQMWLYREIMGEGQ